MCSGLAALGGHPQVRKTPPKITNVIKLPISAAVASPGRCALRSALRRALRESTYTVQAARAAAEPADLASLPRAAAAVGTRNVGVRSA